MCIHVCVRKSFRDVLILEDSVLLPQESITNDQKLLQVFIWSQYMYIVHLVQTHRTTCRWKSEVAFFMGYIFLCVFDIAGLALSPFLLACG